MYYRGVCIMNASYAVIENGMVV
ncbi:phage tail protein, partial [Escherichia coli]|nr:phage tail protein [Escherichia coli]MDZ9379351.1 phage tail protein [Escherichia coli]